MKLLLDEMISPKIARELRGRGDFDVQAIKGDRPDLEAVADREIVRRIAAEQRTLMTNDVLDFQLIHNQMLAAGEEHYGLIFTSDSTMPRNKVSIPLWAKALEKVLTEHPACRVATPSIGIILRLSKICYRCDMVNVGLPAGEN